MTKVTYLQICMIMTNALHTDPIIGTSPRYCCAAMITSGKTCQHQKNSPKISPNRCARFALLTFLQIFIIWAFYTLMVYLGFHEISWDTLRSLETSWESLEIPFEILWDLLSSPEISWDPIISWDTLRSLGTNISFDNVLFPIFMFSECWAHFPVNNYWLVVKLPWLLMKSSLSDFETRVGV